MNVRRLALGAVLIATTAAWTGAHGKHHASPEQTHFSAEDASVKNPVPVPTDVLALLKKDKLVHDVLENENVPEERLPASWFSASKIHLSNGSLADLIVRAEPPLAGGSTDFFWVFRNTGNGYELVLSAPAHDLQIQTHRSNRCRDIEMLAETASTFHSVVYRFDGKRYVIHRDKWEPIK